MPIANEINETLIIRDGLPDSNLQRSMEVTELISHKPGFMVRWGITILLFLAILLLCVSWFIQYPDTVTAYGSLNSINAPKEVVVQSSGKLVKLFVKEGQRVAANEVAGYMESTANHQQVIALSSMLESIRTKINQNEADGIIDYLNNNFDNVGEIQSDYQAFSLAFSTFCNYLSNGFYLRKKGMLNNDMSYLQKLHGSLLQQKGLLQQDLSLTDTTFRAHEILKEQKVISGMDYRNEKSKLLAKEMTIPQISSSIIGNESQQNDKRKEIAELENQILQQKNLFIQALNTLKSRVDEWKMKYLLTAPIDGTVSFSTFLQENQQLKQGQTICFINPGNSNYYVEAVIPQYNFGKVKTGQEVLLKFQAYPYPEFGGVEGTVEFISNAPSDSGYLAKIALPKGLVTNFQKNLQYRTGLSMQAEIITDKRRLLERFFSNFRSKLN